MVREENLTLMKNLKYGVQSYKITTNDRYDTVDYHSNYFINNFFNKQSMTTICEKFCSFILSIFYPFNSSVIHLYSVNAFQLDAIHVIHGVHTVKKRSTSSMLI